MSYQLFLIPILASILAQITKLSTDKIKGNSTWRGIISSYGGMPSSHSAFVSALTAEMALFNGLKSPSFAIALILAILVIRDAVGLRCYIAKQNKTLNKISQKLNLKGETLTERLGHTPLEVFIGCLLGIGLALLFYYIC